MSVARTSNAEAQHKSDYQAVIGHTAHKGYQSLALLAPPIFLLTSIRNKRFSPTSYLRQVGLTTFVGGTLMGVGAGMARLYGMKDEQVHERAVRVRSNRTQTRCDDYGMIGGVLGAIGTTTIFLRRVPLISTVLGGAALGVAGGVLTHIYKAYSEGENLNPEMMLDEAKEAVKKET